MTLVEMCERVDTLAKKLGINQKQLGILLPSMSASQIGRMVNKHAVDPKFDEALTFCIEILELMEERNLLPISPKSKYPVVFRLAADYLLIERKYRYTREEFSEEYKDDFDETGELDFSNDPDICTFKSISHLAANTD